jgi:hypothetical protein
MGVLWLRAKVQLRGRALASLFLALLVGLAGALVLAAAAGARRSEAALPRFLAVNRTVDNWVTVQASDPADDLAKVRRQLAALPEVRQVFRVSGVVGGLILAGAYPAAGAHPVRWHYLLGTVALDPGGSVAFGRPILAAGRLPDERRPEEAAVDEELAERYHLRVGSRYRVGAFTLEQFGAATALAAVAPQGGVVDLRVVGIVRYPMDLDPAVTDQDNALVQHGELYLTPAYWRRYGPNIANYGSGLAVVLRHGQADLPRLQADLGRLYGDRAAVVTQGLDSGETITAGTRRAIGLESAALAGFALLAGLAGLLLVGQTLGRQILLEAADSPILRALGMTRAQLVGVGVVRAAPIAAAGAALAVVGAMGAVADDPAGPGRRPAGLRGDLGCEGRRLRRPPGSRAGRPQAHRQPCGGRLRRSCHPTPGLTHRWSGGASAGVQPRQGRAAAGRGRGSRADPA